VNHMPRGTLLQLIPRTIDAIKIGIVGMGKMGNFHLDVLHQLIKGDYEEYYKGGVTSQLKKIRICGLCDCDKLRLEAHPTIAGYESLYALISEQKPHIVVIATPTRTHRQLAKESLENGVHTFVEKPLVTRSAELDELISVANQKGCRLMSGHVERYNPVAVKIVSLLQTETVKIKSYSFVRLQEHDTRITDDIISDKLIHDIDLALYFFGPIAAVAVKDVREIDGKAYQVRVETIHKDNVRGDIFVSWLVSGVEKKREVTISCDGMSILGDFAEKRLSVNGSLITCEVPGMIKPFNNQIKDELVDFIMHCSEPTAEAERIAPLLTLDEIMQSVSLIDKIAVKTKGLLT
jgi:UDP-N-acetylglucosamine 3-dehydrogenase